MKKNQIKLLFSAVALGMLAMVSPLSAQAGKVTVDKPKFDSLTSPEVGGNTGRKNFKPKEWLEAEVKFKVEMPESYKEKFVDNVTVKWYVAVQNPSGKGTVLIEKTVQHVNVPVGEEVFSSVYLSPSAVMRLSGSDRASKSIVTAIGGEILINGSDAVKNSGYFSSKGKPGWWTSDKLSRYDSVPLLNKDQTPFKFLWWDRYAEIKNDL